MRGPSDQFYRKNSGDTRNTGLIFSQGPNDNHHRARSGEKMRSACLSNRSSNRSDGVTSQKFNKSNRSGRSQGSKRSGMTRNPLHAQHSMRYMAPGIDDLENKIYKDYDSKGRLNQSFQNKANYAGIKNLETKSFRNESPVKLAQERFPEKY